MGKVAKPIGAVARLSQQHGARFVVVMLPERGQVSAVSKTAYGEFDFDKPQHLFAELFTRQDMAYLDLLSIRHSAADNTALCYRYKSHFSVEGDRFAGREITKYPVASGSLFAAPSPKAPQAIGRPVSR